MSNRTSLMIAALVAAGHSGRIGIVNDSRLVNAETLEPAKRESEFDVLIVDEVSNRHDIEELYARLKKERPRDVGMNTTKAFDLSGDYAAQSFNRIIGGKVTREEALAIERQNERQRLKWAEDARVASERVSGAEAKRERRRQRNIRLQQNIDKSVD